MMGIPARLGGSDMIRRLAMLLFATAVVSGRAAEPPKVLATGDWSKPVADKRAYALRGRLVLCEEPRGDGRRHIAVYVELQDASEAIGGPMRIFCDMGRHDFRPEYKGGLHCELRDQDGKSIKTRPMAFSGAVPASEWVKLPPHATIRIRATPFGISREKARAICPQLDKLWEIADDDANEYFLSGTFTVDPPDGPVAAGKEHIWMGTITLPAMKIGK
jgi:hypothetical protein